MNNIKRCTERAAVARGRVSYLSLLFFGILHSNSFSTLPLASLLFQAICKASSENILTFLQFFYLEMILVTASRTVSHTSLLIKALFSKIYKQLMQANITTKQTKLNKKTGRSKQTFFQRRHAGGQKHMKRCSTSLIIREIHIKTTLRYYFTSVRRFIIQNSTNNNFCRVCGEKGTLLHCRWACKLVEPLW